MGKPLSRTRKIHGYGLFIVLLTILAFPSMSGHPVSASRGTAMPTPLERQVREWVVAMSAQKPFAAWKYAEADIQALGPGTHGWLAILNVKGKTVGYMIVYAAADDSFRLGEYGTGPNVLFSPATLAESLRENGFMTGSSAEFRAVPHYVHPFAAVWETNIESDTYWLDAKTGEMLPLARHVASKLFSVSPVPASSPDWAGIAGKPKQSWIGKSFDAYDKLPWLDGQPPAAIENGEKAQRRIRGGLHLRYVIEPYGEAALYALPVVGYVRWSSWRLDLALDMNGTRFISIDMLRQHGRFYE